MNVTSLTDGMVKIVREDGTYLGFPTGISKKSFSVTKLSDRKNSRGWYVHGNIVEEWPVDGFIEAEETIYMIGPYHEGKIFSEILRFPHEDRMIFLARLVEALALLSERSLPLFPLYTNTIIFPVDGGVLFLPPRIIGIVKDYQPIAQRLRYFELHNHPDLKGEANLSFAFGVIAYLLLTGEYPFTSEDEEELHNEIREKAILSPVLKRPELKPEISDLIMAALGKSGKKPPSIEEWRKELKTWSTTGYERIVSTEERQKLVTQAQEIKKKHEAAFGRKNFFRIHGRTIVISAMILSVVGWIGGSILLNVFKPRVTQGYTPEQVVETFYMSVNDLDHMTMEDCVVGNAGKQLVTEVINLFVLTRMRFSVEGTSGFIDAQKWVDDGRPAVPEGRSVYGIAQLSLTPQPAAGEEEHSFLANYEKWQPLTSGADDPSQGQVGPIFEGLERTERLYLRLDKGDWVIYRIDLVSEGPVRLDRAASP